MELRLDNVSIGYGKKDAPLCSNICACATSGRSVALIGSNGEGKSTLLRSIAALMRHCEGEITLDGRSILCMRAEERARAVSFVSTEIISTAYVSVRQIVELGRVPYSGWAGRLSADDVRVVEQAMESTNVGGLAARTVDTLSDGQRQRVMVARALAQATPLLLLDEPTAFLDPENREMIIEMLGNLARSTNKIVLYSTHEVALARTFADDVWRISEGSLSVQ